jgi:hypothetical protein
MPLFGRAKVLCSVSKIENSEQASHQNMGLETKGLCKVTASDTPLAKALPFTHIFQMDFVKWPWKRDTVADYFTASTVSILPTGSPKKMWVRISLKERGFLGRVV